jgi:hypothetical protein
VVLRSEDTFLTLLFTQIRNFLRNLGSVILH